MNFITSYVARRGGFLANCTKPNQMLVGSPCIRTYNTKSTATFSAPYNYFRPTFYCLSGAAVIGGSLCFNQSYHAEASHSRAEKRENAFNTFGFISLKLREVEDINHNVKKFRFDLPNQDHISGLTVSSFVLTRVAKPGTENKFWPSYVFRPYTPISKEDDVGFLDLIVKRYDTDGKGASELIHQLKPGDTLQFFGKPISASKYEPNKAETISMIAAGSGITPMIQLLRKIIDNPQDQTKVHLLYCNRTEQDILLREQLTQLEQAHGDQFQVTYCLSRPEDPSWDGERGRISLDMMKKHLPDANTNTRVYICGPDGFTKLIKGEKGFFGRGKKGLLEDLGYKSEQVQVF